MPIRRGRRIENAENLLPMPNGSPTLMERRVLATGGAGFIGSHLCERLERGDEVLCVDNFYTGTRPNVQHLLSNPLFEVMRHDVCFPLYVEVRRLMPWDNGCQWFLQDVGRLDAQ